MRVDLKTKKVVEFIKSEGEKGLPAGRQGLGSPVELLFGGDNTLYIVDSSGVVWRVYPENAPALRGAGPIKAVEPSLEAEVKPEKSVSKLFILVPVALLGLGVMLIVRRKLRTKNSVVDPEPKTVDPEV